jgi:hypothetical protein
MSKLSVRRRDGIETERDGAYVAWAAALDAVRLRE